jgi:hypothetical protein
MDHDITNSTDLHFWLADCEEFDPGNLGNELPQHKEDRGFWPFVPTLIGGINHNHVGNVCRSEGFIYNVWIELERDKLRSEARVLLHKSV